MHNIKILNNVISAAISQRIQELFMCFDHNFSNT